MLSFCNLFHASWRRCLQVGDNVRFLREHFIHTYIKISTDVCSKLRAHMMKFTYMLNECILHYRTVFSYLGEYEFSAIALIEEKLEKLDTLHKFLNFLWCQMFGFEGQISNIKFILQGCSEDSYFLDRSWGPIIIGLKWSKKCRRNLLNNGLNRVRSYHVLLTIQNKFSEVLFTKLWWLG